ncbi:hypothetical protein OOT46_08050 [Aquabacterium sp. A7-Y]|uniref:hypothetical protein n=1 Tax=Aquabacterium sp. A7-Y TaxID=1349605 RepID=UPI00223DE363|nr:hypothetical protein [Aquabacterium sp. A7-Y]MCW7537801.1 hypothetical protein [Aquabacterium sp. A7-Y]
MSPPALPHAAATAALSGLLCAPLLVFAALTGLLYVCAPLLEARLHVSGLMRWLRRPRGRVAAPPLLLRQLRSVPPWIWIAALLLAFALPVLGWSLLAFALVEALRLRGEHRPRRTLAA